MKQTGSVGVSLWDYGQKGPSGGEYFSEDPDFYRRVLDNAMGIYRPFLTALELQQEAHYLSGANQAWSQIDLSTIDSVRNLLITNRFLAVHGKVLDVDISDHENDLHRNWSLRQLEAAIDFAVKLNADAVTFQPGTFNERAGKFWPKAEEALQITNLRRVTFEDSLRRITAYFLAAISRLEKELATYTRENSLAFQELSGLFGELDKLTGLHDQRHSLRYSILKLIDEQKMPLAVVRLARQPGKGCALSIVNVEPPNFLLNTPRQHLKWHRRMLEIYDEQFEELHLPDEWYERYRPRMVLDPGAMLNSKVILSQAQNHRFGHLFEDFEDVLNLPFVNLPHEYPTSAGGGYCEPLLNRYVRENADHLLYSHIAGCRKMDNSMTTRDPIKAFRTKVFMHEDGKGRPILKYSTNDFESEVELNLEEVVQVVGFDIIWIPTIFDRPYELILSSCTHLRAYLTYLKSEYDRTLGLIQEKLKETKPPENGSKDPVEAMQRALSSARFFIRPHRASGDLWRPGYEHGVFYDFRRDTLGQALLPLNFLASRRDSDGKIWVKGLLT